MRFVYFLFLSFQLLSQTKPPFNPNQLFAPASNSIPKNKAEFISTLNWLKGKSGQNIIYYSSFDDGKVYTSICVFDTVLGTIVNYHFHTLTNGKVSEVNHEIGFLFNVKDISYFEVYDNEENNSLYKVRLFSYNSEYKIKYSSDNDFKKYKLDNYVDIMFSSSVDKAKVKKAFADLLKYAGSKKEKY